MSNDSLKKDRDTSEEETSSEDPSSSSTEMNEDKLRTSERECRNLTNMECANWWYRRSKEDREKRAHVIKIDLLSPMIFGNVTQEDRWIDWACKCGLLPSDINFEVINPTPNLFEVIDLIEGAFDKMYEHLEPRSGDDLVKIFDLMEKVNTFKDLRKAITCAESFPVFLELRKQFLSGLKKRPKGDTGSLVLLLAQNQVYDHVKELVVNGVDRVQKFEKACADGEQNSADFNSAEFLMVGMFKDKIQEKKDEGNEHYKLAKYRAAISSYNSGLRLSTYSYLVYGNRAQCYLKTNNFQSALLDGRRAVLLKPDWHKGQFRYAQAYFMLGNLDRAMEVNKAARMRCKDAKELVEQYTKFQQKEKRRANYSDSNKGGEMAPGKKPGESEPADLPPLVDAGPSDSSGSDGEGDDGNDTSSSSHTDMPDLTSCSSDETDSDDEFELRNPIDVKAMTEKLKKEAREMQKEKARTKKLLKEEAEKARKEEEKRRAAAKEMKQKKRKQKQAKHVKENGGQVDQPKNNLRTTLKQGSNAMMVTNSFRSAVHYYKEGLAIIAEANFQFYDMKEVDFVLLLYAHGTACLKTGIHEELLEAIHQFERILSDHTNIKFPLAYYGLGRVYRKQNRFLEALEPLEKGLELVNTLGNEPHMYKWPGSDIVIDETNPGKLKVAIQDIIRVCQNPPKPDAVCRFVECNGKTQIFLEDPDYKGFVRLICHEACRVDFHPVCWKKLKSNDEEKSGDRDFIDEQCMTPDCHGLITKIQIFDVGGLKTEFKSEKPTAKAEHKGKISKGKDRTPFYRGSFSQTPAKHQKQEKWKQEKEDTKTNSLDDKEKTPPEEKGDRNRSDSISATEKEGKRNHLPVIQEQEELTETAEEQVVVPPDSEVIVLRKGNPEDPSQGAQSKISGKMKVKKTKKIKQTQSLGEFLHGPEADREPYFPDTLDTFEDYGEIPEHSRLRFPPPYDLFSSTFVVPSHLQEEHKAFEASYNSAGNGDTTALPDAATENTEFVLAYVSTMIEEILLRYGTMGISDQHIVQALSMLPDSYQELITEAGGIKTFLSKSGQFLFDGNRIMLQGGPFNDAVAKPRRFNLGNFEQNTFPQAHNPPPGFPKLPDSRDIEADQDAWLAAQLKSRPVNFNPDAEEFYPKSLSPQSSEAVEANAQGNAFENADTSEVKEEDSASNEGIDYDHNNVATKGKDDNFSDETVAARVRNYLMPGQFGHTFSAALAQHREMESLASKTNGSDTKCESDKEFADVKTEGTGGGEFLEVNDSALKSTSPRVAYNSEVNGCTDDAGVNGLRENAGNEKENFDEPRASKLPNGKSAGGGGGADVFVSQKTKGTQTTPVVKSKGVMTDPQQEQYKVDYMKVLGERDTLKEKVKELKEGSKAESQAMERITKKLSSAQQEVKDLSAKLSKETKAKEEQMEKREQEEQHLRIRINVLEQQKQEAEDRYNAVLLNLKKEVSATKAILQRERDEKIQKEDVNQSLTTQCQQQKNRAQDAEVKLLELRRDVGLRFLERAFQESLMTHNHLMQALSARNPTLPPVQKLEEMANTWKTYATECQGRIHQCRASFDEQIQQLKNGQPLSSLPQLPIAGPPQYPGPPILQPLVSQVQGQQLPYQQALENTAVLQPQLQPQTLPQSAQKLPRPHTQVPSSVSTFGAQVHSVAGGAESAAAVGGGPAAENKSKPSNSFEKIMLRLSTMYPSLTRLELTGFIKQVRQNKHGSLTGLSLEDIVASVAVLVEQKAKAGALSTSAPVPAHAPPPRPAVVTGPGPVPATKPPVAPAPVQTYLVEQLNTPTKPSKQVHHTDDDDPCVICHEDMNGGDGVTQLECGHKYHTACIRKWLLGEQSTCPTCRVHALLPDEFPKLNR